MSLRELVEQKSALTVLVFVYEHPGAIQKTIIEGKGRNSKLDRLFELIDAGLIRTESSGDNWTAIKHFVTEEGARIARGWLQIESGEGENYNETSEEQRSPIE